MCGPIFFLKLLFCIFIIFLTIFFFMHTPLNTHLLAEFDLLGKHKALRQEPIVYGIIHLL